MSSDFGARGRPISCGDKCALGPKRKMFNWAPTSKIGNPNVGRTHTRPSPHCFSIRISDRHSSSSFSGPIPRNLLGDFSESSISFHGRRRNRDDGRRRHRRRRHVTIFISPPRQTASPFAFAIASRRPMAAMPIPVSLRRESINCLHGTLTLTRRYFARQFLLCKSSWSRVAP